jgi:class 3 adenylate cyclase
MARLSASERSKLPDSAFAYVDSHGKRMLPIHDEPHVKNALARFDQVKFEDEAARERARKRLLNAAKKYNLVPVGFITGQLRSEHKHAAAGRLVIELGRIGAPAELEQQLRSALSDPTLTVLHWSEAAGAYLNRAGRPVPPPTDLAAQAVTYLERDGRPMTMLVHKAALLDDPDLTDTVLAAARYVIEKESLAGEVWGSRVADAATLPTGVVSIMLTDIESSTALLRQLGGRYADLLDEVRNLIRYAVLSADGREVEVRADEFFAVFERSGAAIEAAVTIQRTLRQRTWTDDLDVRVRIGIHTGGITLTDGGYIGMAVHKAARVCAAGHGGQIVISQETKAALEDAPPPGIHLRGLGRHTLAGMTAATLYQVEADGLLTDFPPLRS